MSSSKEKIRRNPFVPNESGRFEDVYTDQDGYLFRYRLNMRGKGYYMAVGTQSLLDPTTRQPMVVYNNANAKSISSIAIHIPFPKDGEDIETIINLELGRTAAILKHQYGEQFCTARQQGKLLSEMTLTEATQAFLEASKFAVSTAANTQKRYATSVRSIAKAIPTVNIGRIKQSTLLNAVKSANNGGRQKLNDLKAFIDFSEQQQAISSGLLPVIDSAIKKIPKTSANSNRNRRAAINASNSDILSAKAEEVFNQRLYDNKSEANYVALALPKGVGLGLDEICTLKMWQVQRDPRNPEIVFFAIKRSFVSATQDYTFPIFPLEARLINEYINILKDRYGEDRLRGDKYLFSVDDGTTPIAESEVKELCRLELQKLKFGYADLLGRVDLQKDKGVELLRRTYRSRLENCGLTRSEDEGAYLFMLHQSLGTKIQADHYRGLTGESGREFLLSIVMQDRRFIPEEKRRQRKAETYRTVGDRRECILRRKDYQNVQQATIVCELKENERAEFRADHGCVVCIEEVVPLE